MIVEIWMHRDEKNCWLPAKVADPHSDVLVGSWSDPGFESRSYPDPIFKIGSVLIWIRVQKLVGSGLNKVLNPSKIVLQHLLIKVIITVSKYQFYWLLCPKKKESFMEYKFGRISIRIFLGDRIQIHFFLADRIRTRFFSRRSDLDPGITHLYLYILLSL